jgi:hypothetical protein
VVRTSQLTDIQHFVENELAHTVSDQISSDCRYASIPQSLGSMIINADIFRELSPWYSSGTLPSDLLDDLESEVPEFTSCRYDRFQSRRLIRTHLTTATTIPASSASKDYLLRRIKWPMSKDRRPRVLIVNGGSGSGKTRFVTAIPKRIPSELIVYDTTLTSDSFGDEIVEYTRSAGGIVVFCYIYAHFVIAMERMIQRACREGRYISATGMAKNHSMSSMTMLKLMDKYENCPDIQFSSFRSDVNNFQSIPIETLRNMKFPSEGKMTDDAYKIINIQIKDIPPDLLRRIIR